jgi:AcrR family transcriptional regulator
LSLGVGEVQHGSSLSVTDAVGVMPNALYTYFARKAAIRDAVLDDLLGDVRRRQRVRTHPLA